MFRRAALLFSSSLTLPLLLACGDDTSTSSGSGGSSGTTTATTTATSSATTTSPASTSSDASSATSSGSGGNGEGGNGEGGNGEGGNGEGGNAATEVHGIVTAYRHNEFGIESLVLGATVEITDGDRTWSATSDAFGMFAIADVPPGDGYRVTVLPPEPLTENTIQPNPGPFAEWHEPLTVLEDVSTPVMPVLVGGCSSPVSLSGNAGEEAILGTVAATCGYADIVGELRVPQDGLLRENGDVFTGLALLDFSPIHYPVEADGIDMRGVVSMPGALTGSDGGDPGPINTFAAVDVSVRAADTDEELELADGVVGTVRMRGWRTIEDGDDPITSWSFDPETSSWTEEGTCETDPDDPQMVLCEISHFSWWNADRRTAPGDGGDEDAPKQCVSGSVTYDDEAVFGATVAGITEEGIAGGGESRTDEAGDFCVNGPPGRDWNVQVRQPNGREILRAAISVAAGEGEANCTEPAGCAQAGEIQLSTFPTRTVTGELHICDEELYPEEICGPMPAGGFEFGTTVRVIGALPNQTATFLLGEIEVEADGTYSVEVPEGIYSLAFSSPPQGYCVTYFNVIPPKGDPTELEVAEFICGS